MKTVRFVSIVAMIVAGASAARAQEVSAENQAAATAIFNEAKEQMNAGKLDEACPKFELSLKFDKRIGTTLNLADCYEKAGKISSAWARFVEAQTLAQRANQPERVQFAKDHADALAPKLPRVRIAIADKPAGLEVLRDAALIDVQVLGVAIPIDPGKHVITARAPLRKPASREIEISSEAKITDVVIPNLEDDLEAIARAKVVATGHAEPFWSAQRIVGVATAIAGVAGVGVGTAFGVSAMSQWSDASGSKHCTTTGCDPQGVSEGKDAANAATISTIGFIAGGVLVAGGVVLFITGGHKSREQKTGVYFAPSIGGATLGGFF